MDVDEEMVISRGMSADIMIGLNAELDGDSLNIVKIACQDKLPHLSSELISAETFLGLLSILLGEFNNDMAKIIPILNRPVREAVSDVYELLDKLQKLSDYITDALTYLGLAPGGRLIGREKEMQSLINSLDFKQDRHTHVINVCGMSGIGKSYLVKHLAFRLMNEGSCSLVYVDCSQTTTLYDILLVMLQKFGVRSPGNQYDLKTALLHHLVEKKDDHIILVLDDLSHLMSSAESTASVLSLLDDLIRHSAKYRKRKLKLVITTQSRLFDISEEDTGSTEEQKRKRPAASAVNEAMEDKETFHIKRKLVEYTKDLSLDLLSLDEARLFFGPALSLLQESAREELLSNCHGHPYSLHFVSGLINNEITLSTENVQITQADTESINSLLAEDLHALTYSKFNTFKQRVLLALAMFEGDAQLSALHYVLGETSTARSFAELVKKEFKDDFWLRFKVFKMIDYRRALKNEVVSCYHPLIWKFLQKKISSLQESADSADKMLVDQLMKRFVVYHANLLTEIGQACIPADPTDTKFITDVASKFMQNCGNCKRAIAMTATLGQSYLFCHGTGVEVSQLKPTTDILNLFVCLCEYHDCFENQLNKTLEDLLSRTDVAPNVKAVTWTLHIIVLIQSQDWLSLENTFLHERLFPDLAKLPADLASFSIAMQNYAKGLVLCYHSKYQEERGREMLERRKTHLDTSITHLASEVFSTGTEMTRKYFTAQILLTQAEAAWIKKRKRIENIKTAVSICRETKKCVRQVPILQPLVNTKLAFYLAKVGDKTSEYNEASRIYEEVRVNHERAKTEYEKRHQGSSGKAAHNLERYALLMKSWSHLITGEVDLPLSKVKEAMGCLKQAYQLASDAATIFSDAKLHNMHDLVYAYYHAADSNDLLHHLYEIHEPDDSSLSNRRRHRALALKYYKKAYSCIRLDYRRCHIGPNDMVLKNLSQRLPEVMKLCEEPDILADKVKKELEIIQELLHRGTQEPPSFSDADTCTSSEYSSSDDDFTSSMEQISLVDKTSIQASYDMSHPIPQTTDNVQGQDPAEEKSDDEASLSKRKRIQ